MSSIAVERPQQVAEPIARERTTRRLPRSPQFWLGFAIVSTAVLVAAFAPLLAPYDPLAQDIYARHEGPSMAHPLGLDEFGRDILSRVMYGARITLTTAVAAIAIALPIGSILGAVAGFRRGWVDALVMRVLDVQLAYPGILLALVLIVALGPSQRSVVIALAAGYIPYFARIVRGAVMSEAAMEYVAAAESLGQRRSLILARHNGPAVAGLVAVHGSFAVSGAMVTEASLSFLGLGVSPSNPSWGRMLSSGAQVIYIAPHVAVVPIVALSVVIVGWFYLGEGLREWFDPRRG